MAGPISLRRCLRGGKKPQFLEGHRITDKETLDIAIDVLVNRVSASIASKIASMGGTGVCTWHKGKSLLTAEKYLLETKDEAGLTRLLDLGFVGRVTQIHKQTFYDICETGKIPIVPPIAQGQDGEMFNINADNAAAFIAESLKAEKIVFISNTHGIMTDPKKENSFASTLHEKEVYTLIEQKIITGGMLPKARACISALLAGVKKAHIIDGRIPHSLLLEIFTDKGIGTQIIV
ncbi:MAG: amino acid kinase family protein [Candidatus Brocadiales bacterium]